MATVIARGDGWSFWRIGENVYRAADGASMDVFGHPNGKRWECDYSTWVVFRDVFAWAADV